MQSTGLIIVAFAMLVALTNAAAHQSNSATPIDHASCQLQCKNGGYCALKDFSSPKQLQTHSMEGHLVEKCICPEGYTGVACESKLGVCNMEDMTCPNGESCRHTGKHRWSCDCSVADSMSVFAGQMCRDPITQYCGAQFIAGKEEQGFCTNGGKCKIDFLRAKASAIAAMNTADFANAGCVCPPEYAGPHCEWLIDNDIGSYTGEPLQPPAREDVETTNTPAATSPTSTTSMENARLYLIATLAFTSMALMLIVAMLRRRRSSSKKKNDPDPDSMVVDYNDLKLPGYLKNISPFYDMQETTSL